MLCAHLYTQYIMMIRWWVFKLNYPTCKPTWPHWSCRHRRRCLSFPCRCPPSRYLTFHRRRRTSPPPSISPRSLTHWWRLRSSSRSEAARGLLFSRSSSSGLWARAVPAAGAAISRRWRGSFSIGNGRRPQPPPLPSPLLLFPNASNEDIAVKSITKINDKKLKSFNYNLLLST